MLKSFIFSAYRNLTRNKAFSLINIIGLATGLATCLLLLLFIFDELQYDQHHKNANRLYRVASITAKGESWAALPAPLARSMKADFPEIEESTRLLKWPDQDKILLSREDDVNSQPFYESNGYYVDSTFFQLFTYDFIYGNAHTVFEQPNSLVLASSISEKLFGHQNPVGKPVKVRLGFGEFTYTVQGVFKDDHQQSHIPARFFLSMRNNDIGKWVEGQSNWAANNIFHTYITLRKNADPVAFEQKLRPYMDRRGGVDLKAAGFSKRLFLQPVKDIYLHSDIGNEIAPAGRATYLYMLTAIGVFILLIACINFMNLSTAGSVKRAKEVGVRKVIGAGKRSLVLQFLGESLLMSCLSLLLAMMLASILLPYFNAFTGKALQPFGEPALIGWITALALVTGLMAGLYPAFYLSAFKPIAVLKGKIVNSIAAAAIRKGLVVFQFTISICLVIGAIVIWQQLHFLRNQPLGFNKEQQLIIPLQGEEVAQKYRALKNELLKDPHVRHITSGSSYPGIPNILAMLFYGEGKTVQDAAEVHLSTVSVDYTETLGLKLVNGRSFTKTFQADSNSIVLNEAAIKKLGYTNENAIGRKIYYDWQNEQHTMTIVGVLKDFHYESLHHDIKPFALTTAYFANPYSYLIANIATNDYGQLLAAVEKTWQAVNPATPFEYSFLDTDFQKNYEQEQRTARIVGYFTIIAILIAGLGLFGLSVFAAEQRTREIGIRKVLGASAFQVTTLLSGDFVKLVLIAIVIASPLAWFMMQEWLKDFAYRIDISGWIFVLAACFAMLVALITVSFQAIKSALANPVKSLRAE